MAANPLSPDGKWMLTQDGWVFLDSDPSKTPDGKWTFTNGRFVHAQHIGDEYINGPVHLVGDVSSNRELTKALFQANDSVITGDVNVTVNQGPSTAEIKEMLIEILSQVGASTFQNPTNLSDAHRKLITKGINSYDQLISEGAVSDPATELMVATAANVKGDYRDAKRRLGELLRAHPESSEANDAIQVLAQISIRLGEWTKAEEWVKEAMARFETSGNWPALGHTLQRRARIFASKGDYQRAIEMCDEAIEIAKREKMQQLHGRTLANRGKFLLNMGLHSEARDALSQSLPLAIGANDTASVLSIKKSLHDVYLAMGDRFTASRLLRESRADMNQTDDKYTLAQEEMFEAEIQEKMKNLQMARDRYKKAERMFSEIGANNKQGEICIRLADLDNDENHFESAILWYSKALDCFRELPESEDKMYCYGELGDLYYMTEKVAESIKYSTLAIELATQLQDFRQQLTSLLTLCSAQCINNKAEAKKTLSTAKALAHNHGLEDDRLPKLDAKLANTQR